MTNISHNKLLLTPECQDLWLLSPKQLLLYEQIQIDEQDLHLVLNPKKDTRFAAMKARSAERLLDWGLLEPIDYRTLLPEEARCEIRRIAQETVEGHMPDAATPITDSRFYHLSVYTHERYAAYLERTVTACPFSDGVELRTHVSRLDSIQKRLTRLETGDLDDDLLSDLRWTLERIAAKSVPGLYLSRKTGNLRLYDTDEYSPFIDDVVVPTSAGMTVFDPAEDVPILAASVAALGKKCLADIGIADEYRLFSSVRDSNEFLALRRALRTMEELFGEMVNEKTDIVRRKISVEVERLNAELNERFEEACNTLGERAKFVSIEMLAGQFAGFLSPWINKAKESAGNEKLHQLRTAFLEREDLAGSLFFMMDVWQRHKVLEDERYQRVLRDRSDGTIWGQDKTEIPWYEDVSNHAIHTDENSATLHSRR